MSTSRNYDIPDFGFQIDESLRPDDDLPDPEAKLFLDCRDAEDMLEDENDNPKNEMDDLINQMKSSSLSIPPGIGGGARESEEIQMNECSIVSLALDTKSLNFGQDLLKLVNYLMSQDPSLNTEFHFESLREFVIGASPELLEKLLETVTNHNEVADAIHRLRALIGVTKIDPHMDYQFYYIYSCCTDELCTDDYENIIATNMLEIIEQIFTGTIYITSDGKFNIVMLPTRLSEMEKDFIKTNQIWGVQATNNPLDQLNDYIRLDPSLDERSEDLQIEVREKFMREIAPRFPNLSSYRIGSMLHEDSYLMRFNWISQDILKFLPDALDVQVEHESDLFSKFLKPIISVSKDINALI